MSDEDNKKPSKAEQMNAEVKQGGKQWPKPEEAQATAAPEEPSVLGHESVDTLEQELNETEQKLNEYWNEIMRSKAEVENVRRRAELDVAKERKFAVERLLKDLLPVIDSLSHALQCEYGDNVFAKSIHEGVEMTVTMLNTTLERHGIKVVDPLGEVFDPKLHEAIGMEPAGENAPNSVIRVMQKGYLLNDRLVRPAMVVVAK